MLAAGTRLGPYEVGSLIGAGGMGEVYRARDPRLDREVAVKVIRGECVEGPDRLKRFEREARAAAALNHPNILTVHDVGAEAGTAFVVTELLDGETLRSALSRCSPAPAQVLSYAVQAAQGLAAAHRRGIVHRDLKPENLFVTLDGRVKILDFGVAKLAEGGGGARATEESTRTGVLVGTVAYMSPEQVKSLAVDARSDIFSLGIVLYELLSHRHPFRRDTAGATLTAILQDTPPDLTSLDSSIAPTLTEIVRRCLEKEPEQRFQSAHDLALALEAVRVASSTSGSAARAEERSPYPGLASFTEKDAAVFFGREAEVDALWRRLRGRRLLAVIGPSGTGKTSLVRAGVIASRPAGWAAIACTPGSAPFRALGRALAPELAGDPDALRQLVSFDEVDTAVELVARWRAAHSEALLVVDQFEELFTLNPGPTRELFASFLGRLARESDVHVLLAMRDDFFFRCSDHEALAPVFESTTPLATLRRDALRKALVEPAGRFGFRFEDEALVDEMVQAVEGSRGALPLLAFAMAQLWELRDRERRVLTRAAYEEVGGVAGALAQHAEAALERIGPERQPIVREILRNLVTAEGTRAVAERDELLTLAPEHTGIAEVLGALIDSRLVTSYEVEGSEGQPPRHRVELVHESLLRAWPRLVRWRAQDEEGALLRDQLRQAAHLWDAKGRTRDLLWTGTSFREFELWRERYAGALTAIEEDFARAMVDRARRTKRLWSAAVASAIVGLAGIAIAIGVSRQQAAHARDRAEAEALRAEAGRLLALGQAQVDRYPTAALAYVRRSLELADTPEARRFAVEVLWRGPVARILSPDPILGGPNAPENPLWSAPAFSPDAKWLALENGATRQLLIFAREGGEPRIVTRPPDSNASVLAFGSKGDVLVAGGPATSVQLWSLPELREIGRLELGGVGSGCWLEGDRLYTLTQMSRGDGRHLLRSWTLPGGDATTLGTLDWSGVADSAVATGGRSLAYSVGRSLRVLPLDGSRKAGWLLGTHRDTVQRVVSFPGGERLASVDKTGEIRIWPPGSRNSEPTRVLRGPRTTDFLLAANETYLVRSGVAGAVHLWDLGDPPDAEPVGLKRSEVAYGTYGGFDPSGRWLAATNSFSVAFWPVAGPWKRVLPGLFATTWSLAFTPDGRWLVSCTLGQAARLWPMTPAGGESRSLGPPESCWGVAAHPASTHVLATSWPDGHAFLQRITGGPAVPLSTGWEGQTAAPAVAFDRSGLRAAACPGSAEGLSDPKLRVLRLWDLESGRGRSISLARFVDRTWACDRVAFAPDGAVLLGGNCGVIRVVAPEDPNEAVSVETLYKAARADCALSRDGRQLLVWTGRVPTAGVFEELLLFDLATRTSRPITTHGRRLWTAAFDPSGRTIVTGDIDGVVRAGPVTGEEPHLLLGHTAQIISLAVSPDGRWIASASDDALYLWPMPDVSKPPLHTLPHADLMAKLDALTNLRVVRDPASSTGWKLDVGPFPGWKEAPTW